MRQLLVLAAVTGLAIARPETYREKEDFQYSRSSSDEGSKSGFYGAQRGNMGGNYERAHNMDPLAQNQMSGLVRQVDGELGDGAKQKTGSVFTAANSRGVYGSGHYDLNNLEGRNFQEGVSFGDSQSSHSSLTSHHGSAYKGQYAASTGSGYGASSSQSQHNSRYGGYNTAGNTYSNNHLATGDLQSASQYEDRSAAHNSGLYSQAGYQGQAYDQGSTVSHTSNGQGSAIHSRLVSGTPVRIIIRPGTRVTVPVAAQTYDMAQSSASTFDQNADVSHSSVSSFDQNAINSEADVLNSDSQHVVVKPTRPKHYESSYSYRKEWEKHDTKPVAVGVPLAIPTVNPYPAHSELYDDVEEQRASGVASQSHHSSHSGYNALTASSRHQADYNAQHHSAADNAESTANTHVYKTGATRAYNAGATGHYASDATGAYNADGIGHYTGGASGAYNGATSGASGLQNRVEDSNTKPKSYQSSYSYHKSWEHQGDPYIIKPSTNGLYDAQTSGKLVTASLNQGAYGSRHQSHQQYSANSDVDCDCDENGHIRVARSYNTQEDLAQETQQQWDKIEDLGQETQKQWGNLELGQQSQNKWDNLQSEGQQAQKLWDQAGQQTQQQWDKIEDLGQQAQTQWDQRTEEAGQQTQNAWDKLELEPQNQTDQGQLTQQTWSMFEVQVAGNDDKISEPKQIVVGNSNKSHPGMDAGYHRHDNAFQSFQPLDNLQHHQMDSHTLGIESTNQNQDHHVHSIWDEIKKEEIGQENEDTVESDLTQTTGLGHQTQTSWSEINQNDKSFNPTWDHTINKDQFVAHSEHTNEAHSGVSTPNPHPWMYNRASHHRYHHNIDSSQYHSESSYSDSISGSHSYNMHEHSMNTNNGLSNTQTHSSGSTPGSSVMSLWDKLDTIEKDTIPSHGANNDYKETDTSNGFATHSVFSSYNTDNKPIQSTTVSITSNTAKPNTEATKDDDTIRPLDIGRGDIGPEDLVKEQSDELPNLKSYKTSDEIETLSLTKETNKHDNQDAPISKDIRTEDVRELSVVSLDEQKHPGNHKLNEEHSRTHNVDSITTSINTTPKVNHYMHHNINSQGNDKNERHETQFENQDQQNLEQISSDRDFVRENTSKQATDQQTVNFGQHNENFGQQTVNVDMDQMKPESENPEHRTQKIEKTENFHQESNKHQAEDHQNEYSDQVSHSGWQPEDQKEQQLENWGPNENLEQQSQMGWKENMESQQVQTAWEPTEDLQQHSQLTDTFTQPEETGNLNQQVQAAWEPTEDLQQHSQLTDTFTQPEEMGNLNQQVQAAWEPTEDLQQHSQLTDTFTQPEEMGNLNQQVQAPWEPTEDLQQQSQQTDKLSQSMVQNPPPTHHKQQPKISEEIIVPSNVDDVNSPPEPTTEKTGFWKSVGSKFTNAKDKVASWFKSS